jgi:hypothetical protein
MSATPYTRALGAELRGLESAHGVQEPGRGRPDLGPYYRALIAEADESDPFQDIALAVTGEPLTYRKRPPIPRRARGDMERPEAEKAFRDLPRSDEELKQQRTARAELLIPSPQRGPIRLEEDSPGGLKDFARPFANRPHNLAELHRRRWPVALSNTLVVRTDIALAQEYLLRQPAQHYTALLILIASARHGLTRASCRSALSSPS